jgi:parvulin-like peptidyl-prolyl isomerase
MKRSLTPLLLKLGITKMRIFLSLALLTSFSLSAQARIVDRIAAMVNDDIIAQSDADAYRKKLQTGNQLDELLVPDEKVREQATKDDKKLLAILIDAKILEYEIKKQNLQATIERVEQEIRTIAERNHINRAELKQALAQQGTTLSEYQDFIKSQIERQSLIEKAVNSKIKISDEEVTNYYVNQNGAAKAETFEYTIDHILFSTKGGGAEADLAARQRAEVVLRKLKENSSFETLVTQYSDDPRLSSGGRLGTFKAGELSKEFAQAVAGLQVGETSGVVKSRAGYHILKLESKHLVPDPRLEADRENIRKRLYEMAFKKQFQFWLDQRRQETIIRINV